MKLSYTVLKEAADAYFHRCEMRLVLIEPSGKRPLAGSQWTNANPCPASDSAAFMAAIDAEEAAGRPVPNIAAAARHGDYLIVDLDTKEQVKEFFDFLGVEELPFMVKTPGQRNSAGEMVHKDGGHIYYWTRRDSLLEANPVLGKSITLHGATIQLDGAYALLPPSERAEGVYELVGEQVEIPAKLEKALVELAREKKEKKEKAAPKRDEHPAIEAWMENHSWSDILTEEGWAEVGEESCGCATWLRPGMTGSKKSAVAHEGCGEHGSFLHLFTDAAPGAVGDAFDAFGKNLTKMQVIAHTEHGGNVAAVFREIERDYNDGSPLDGGHWGLVEGFSPAPVAAEAEPDEEEAEDTGRLAERLAAWVAETEGDLGRELTEQQKAELGRYLAPPGKAPRWELAPGKERKARYGVDRHPVSAAEMKQIFDHSDVTRQIFWEVTDMRVPGSPLVTLLQQMLRVARRVDPSQSTSPFGGHQPISTYALVVGRSGTGKSSAMRAPVWSKVADPLWERDIAFSPSTPHAIAERIFEDVKVEGTGGKDSPAEYERVLRKPAVAALEIGELSQMLEGSAKSTGHGGGLLPALAAAWSGENFATSSKSGGVTSLPPEGRYTITMMAGIQPRKAAPLLETADLGLRQRVVMIPATCPTRRVLTESDIARPAVQEWTVPHPPLGETPLGFKWCDEMIAAFEEAQMLADVDFPSEEETRRSQSFPMRFRLAAICAAMHRTFEISSDMWEWSGILVAISERCGVWIEHELAEAAAEASREVGKQRGISAHAAKQAEADEQQQVLERALEIVREGQAREVGYADRTYLNTRCGRGRRAEMMTAIQQLVRAGQVTEEQVLGGNNRPTPRWRIAV